MDNIGNHTSIPDTDEENLSVVSRSEPLRAYIVSLLLKLGLSPETYNFAVVARLIETTVLCPNMTLSEAITAFANTHNTDKNTVSRLVDKFFDVYDEKLNLTNKVFELTGARPITAKDVLSDLAVFAGVEYYDRAYENAQHIE